MQPIATNSPRRAAIVSDEVTRSTVAIETWFWSGALLTFLILVIGGITRLTQSGLSMVDWEPIIGVVPPIGHAEWEQAFTRYRQFPEYQLLRQGMTLGEFQFIYFWEFLHRMLARLIGLVFLVPALVFWLRRRFDSGLKRRALLLFALGGLQGFMGWFMVSSGLIDRPHVSHYRLAIHLAIAFAIFGSCVWFALELRLRRNPAQRAPMPARLRRWLMVVGGLLVVQILWGALVAGLDAGAYSDTFPLMNGKLIPPFAFGMDPLLLNFLENPLTVQWVHRVLGTALVAAIVGFAVSALKRGNPDPGGRWLAVGLLAAISMQYLLGILTVVLHVPIPVAAAHQALAMVIFGIWLALLHRARPQAVRL